MLGSKRELCFLNMRIEYERGQQNQCNRRTLEPGVSASAKETALGTGAPRHPRVLVAQSARVDLLLKRKLIGTIVRVRVVNA